MANKDSSKQWFLTGFYPTQSQFAQVFEWLRWKDEKLDMDNITGLTDAINAASKSGGNTTVVVECITDHPPKVTGTNESVTGIIAGSLSIVSAAFINTRLRMFRGNLRTPGVDPLDGSYYYTKSLNSDTITLNACLGAGEFIIIETIN